MAFLRRKGNAFYLVHNVRKGGRVRQLHLAKLGERPRITDVVIRQVSRSHPFVDVNWSQLREEVNNRVELFDPKSSQIQKLVSTLRTLNLDLADLFPPLLDVSQGPKAGQEIITNIRLLHSTLGVKLDQFDRVPVRDALGDQKFRVEVIEFSRQILLQLQKRPDDIFKLDADQFELLLCDRLQAMGMWVRRIGSVYEGDGGIDIIAGPERYPVFPFLLAVQAKHHNNRQSKTGPSPVRELKSVIQSYPFQAGMLITNTSFTASAQWEAEHRPHLVRLRDFNDLSRWIHGSFLHEAEWREMPEFIEYAPGKRILIPKYNS